MISKIHKWIRLYFCRPTRPEKVDARRETLEIERKTIETISIPDVATFKRKLNLLVATSLHPKKRPKNDWTCS